MPLSKLAEELFNNILIPKDKIIDVLSSLSKEVSQYKGNVYFTFFDNSEGFITKDDNLIDLKYVILY